MPINKRNIRDLRSNFLRHFGIFALILISCMVIVGISASIDSVISTTSKEKKDCHVEDGYVQLSGTISEETVSQLKEDGIQIEDQSYYDETLKKGKTLRIFANRNEINLLKVTKGKAPKTQGQVVLSKAFALANHYEIDDKIEIDGVTYTVSGYGVSPDYINILCELTDTVSNSEKFGLCYMNEADAKAYFQSTKPVYQYSYVLNNADKDKMLDAMKDEAYVIADVEKKDNARISNYEADVEMIKNVSVIIALLLVIIVSFGICNYIASVIDAECVIIGTLFSLGYSKKELCYHYISLPAIVVSAASVAGTILGVFFGDIFIYSVISSYNFPDIQKVVYPYHVLLGIALPIILVLSVNVVMIMRKLSIEPLRLLRKDIKKKVKTSHLKLQHLSFLKRYQMKETMCNFVSIIVLSVGIVLSMFLLMFSFGIWNSLDHYIADIRSSIQYEHSYYLKGTDGLEAFEHAAKVSSKEMLFHFNEKDNEKVVLTGIDKDCEFYDFSVPDDKQVMISYSVSKKFGVEKGDEIKIEDPTAKEFYKLKVKAVVPEKNGYSIFMNRNKMNELLNQDNSYYNVLLSKKKLDIDNRYLYKETTKKDQVSDIKSVLNRLLGLCILLIIVSVLVCNIFMAILIKVQLDRSSFSVTLVSVFGYNVKECMKVYLFPVKVSLVIGILAGLPVSYFIFAKIWPMLIVSMQTFIDVHYYWFSFAAMIAIYICCFFMSKLLFKRRFKKIDYVSVMKARE